MKPAALITGITGQDGSYLAESLIADGYDVHGIIRRASTFNTARIDHLYTDRHNDGLRLHYGDVTDGVGLIRILEDVQPTEIYHLAAQSHVRVSFDQPVYTGDVGALGTLRLLEAVKEYVGAHGVAVRVYNACSSEMFGNAGGPQSERTPFAPRSPYGVAKLAAYWHAVNYRDGYGLDVCNGILFNHESERRGETFVTRKITRAVGRIKHGLQETLYLGNVNAKRDWGYAPDYVAAMRAMIAHDTPGDFVIATGEAHSVKEFARLAFAEIGADWRDHVEIDTSYYRPTEITYLRGDAGKARDALGWVPRTSFDAMVKRMVSHDVALAAQEAAIKALDTTGAGAGMIPAQT